MGRDGCELIFGCLFPRADRLAVIRNHGTWPNEACSICSSRRRRQSSSRRSSITIAARVRCSSAIQRCVTASRCPVRRSSPTISFESLRLSRQRACTRLTPAFRRRQHLPRGGWLDRRRRRLHRRGIRLRARLGGRLRRRVHPVRGDGRCRCRHRPGPRTARQAAVDRWTACALRGPAAGQERPDRFFLPVSGAAGAHPSDGSRPRTSDSVPDASPGAFGAG